LLLKFPKKSFSTATPGYINHALCLAGCCDFSRSVQFPPMGTKRGFWRSRPAIAEEVENGTPISIEARRPHRVIGYGVGMALVAIRDCG
jgi:hypothetical protein